MVVQGLDEARSLMRPGMVGKRLVGAKGVRSVAAVLASLSVCAIVAVSMVSLGSGGREGGAFGLLGLNKVAPKIVRYMYVPAAVAEGDQNAASSAVKVKPHPLQQKSSVPPKAAVQVEEPMLPIQMDAREPAFLSITLPQLADNDTNTGNGTSAGWEIMARRSCAISSLIEQAKAVIEDWNECGYTNNLTDPKGVISGPSDDKNCE